MRKWIASVTAVVLMGTATVATAQEAAGKTKELTIGDPAPKLEVAEFVKGDAVKSLEKGKVYVVEFWATWCGPCKVSIPHLTELQKKHKDVKFIGVSISEQDQAEVKPFVAKMGADMDYAVAMDSVKSGEEGKMSKGWMSAAGEAGIPTAFVIDKDNKIAWIGHPSKLDKPLEEILAGKFDRKAALAERTAEKTMEAKKEEIGKKLAQAQEKGASAFLKAIDEVIAEFPPMEAELAPFKFTVLLGPDGDPDKAAAFGTKLADGVYADSPEALNLIAWTIVDPAAGKRSEKLVKLALKAAIKADELSKKENSAIADTLAKAYFDSGDKAKALESQERAMKLLQKEENVDADQVKEMKERLEEYRKAAKK